MLGFMCALNVLLLSMVMALCVKYDVFRKVISRLAYGGVL